MRRVRGYEVLEEEIDDAVMRTAVVPEGQSDESVQRLLQSVKGAVCLGLYSPVLLALLT